MKQTQDVVQPVKDFGLMMVLKLIMLHLERGPKQLGTLVEMKELLLVDQKLMLLFWLQLLKKSKAITLLSR